MKPIKRPFPPLHSREKQHTFIKQLPQKTEFTHKPELGLGPQPFPSFSHKLLPPAHSSKQSLIGKFFGTTFGGFQQSAYIRDNGCKQL